MAWVALAVSALLLVVGVFIARRLIVSLGFLERELLEASGGFARDMGSLNQIVSSMASRCEGAAQRQDKTASADRQRLDSIEASLAELVELRDSLRRVAQRNRELLKQPVA